MNAIEKGQFAATTIQCYNGLCGDIESFPALLKRLIEERIWEHRVHRGRQYELPNLRTLITAPPPTGWGKDPEEIRHLLNKLDPEAEVMFREEMKREPGRPKEEDKTNYNIMEFSDPKQGTSRAYSIDRVKREAPQYAEEVMSGRMSPNKALVKAGIRENRQIYIPKDPKKLVPKLIEAFGEDYATEVYRSLRGTFYERVAEQSNKLNGRK